MRFEWDPRKAAQNLKKHRVGFSEAETAFADEAGWLLDDPDSPGEERYVLLGFSGKGRLLVVVHTYREAEAVIRIISARKATSRERRQYEEDQDQ